MSGGDRRNGGESVVGIRYGRLVVFAEGPRHRQPNGKLRRVVHCACDCGGQKTVQLANLREGKTASCGCYQREVAAQTVEANLRTHGKSKTRMYAVWKSMKRRCNDPKAVGYTRYGGRGITVCARWNESVDAFLEDMGDCPPGMSLERIDNNLGYSKDNCRWATRKEQGRNKRNNVLVSLHGDVMPLSEAAERVGCDYRRLRGSLFRNSQFAKTVGVEFFEGARS